MIIQNIFSTVLSESKPTLPHFVGSVNEVYREISSRTKGALGEKVIKDYFTSIGKTWTKSISSYDYDFSVDGHRVEVKLGAIDINGKCIMEQIRPDASYDRLVFVIVTPSRVNAYWASKSEISANSTKQHNVMSHWIRDIDSNNLPGYLKPIDTF